MTQPSDLSYEIAADLEHLRAHVDLSTIKLADLAEAVDLSLARLGLTEAREPALIES